MQQVIKIAKKIIIDCKDSNTVCVQKDIGFCMRLWTVQPEEVFDIIEKHGVFHCDSNKSELILKWGFKDAYLWLSDQMEKRIGPAPEGVIYPIWAWHTMRYEHKRPDMRYSEFRIVKRPFVLMEIEIPDEQVLLSDEVSWHIVLNDGYDPEAKTDAEFDQAYEYYQCQPDDVKKKMRIASWNNVFDITRHNEYDWRDKFIQATFWELKKDNIVKVWHYK